MEHFTAQNLQCTAGKERVSAQHLNFQVVEGIWRHQIGCKHILSEFKRGNLRSMLFMEGLSVVESSS